jgi:hypothetical protein
MLRKYNENSEIAKTYVQLKPLYTLTSNDVNLENSLYVWLQEVLKSGLEPYLIETFKDWRRRSNFVIFALPPKKVVEIGGKCFIKRRRLKRISLQTKKHQDRLLNILNNFYTAIIQKNAAITNFNVFTDRREVWTLWFSTGDSHSALAWEQLGFTCIADLLPKYPKREMTIVETIVEREDLVDWV